MKNIMKNKKILLILTIILGLGISLSAIYYIYYKKDSRTSSITSGLISIDFKEKSNVILSSNVPVIDDVGLEGTPYEFSVENTSRVPIKGTIKLNVINNTIPLGAVRYGIYINDELVKKDYVHDDKILYEIEEILVNEKVECKIYFWVDYYYDQPNKTFDAKIIVEGEQKEIAGKKLTVTFDANGGTVDTQSKEVVFGSNYGELPIPTREGYTFMGWNGKNLLNYNIITDNALHFGISVDINGNVYDKTPTSDSRLWDNINNCNWTMVLDSGNYTFSILFTTRILNDVGRSNSAYKITPIYANWGLYNIEKDVYTFSLTKSTDIGILIKGYDGIYKVQLENGNQSTEWEPYYITSSTKVVQNNNHTLKAIWKEN